MFFIEKISLKLQFYILSLWLLFVFIIIATIKIPIAFGDNVKFIGFDKLFSLEVFPVITIVAIALFFICFLFWYNIKYEFNGTSNMPYTIISVKNKDFDSLAFFSTYIVPLICFDLDDVRYQIILGLILFLIGVFLIKMKLYFANPTLFLLGFNLYEFKLKGEENPITVISKDKLKADMQITCIEIDKKNWCVKEYR